MSKPIALDDSNFDQQVLKSTKPVLVDFWAPRCGPCRMVAPIIDELAGEYDGKVVFGKVDVDQNQRTASRYGIMSIPALIIFKNGQPVATLVGSRSKAELKRNLDGVLGK